MSDSVTPWYKVANLFDMIFRPQSAFILITMILGVLLLLSFVANYKNGSPAQVTFFPGAVPSPLVQRSVKAQPPKAPAAAPAPVLQAKAVAAPVPAPLLAPKVFKVEPKEQKKTHSELNTEHKPVLQTKMFVPASVPTATIGVSAAPAPVAVPASASTKLDSTYEAYRNAMLSSGPRGQLEASKLQTKSGSAGWRERVPNLKLPDSDTASFLERTNVSVNDRMVAIFDAVKA